jgi:hypothetical protein
MVNVTCKNNDCANADIEFNVLGNHEVVECGGCATKIKPSEILPDPQMPSPFPIGQ